MSDSNSPSRERLPARASAQQEDEVYAALGALLGTLEVVATDDSHPISRVQTERLTSALRLGHELQHQLEALLTLAAEDLPERLRRAPSRVRPLVEHAVRGARRTFESYDVELRMPAAQHWGEQSVVIDAARVDRTLRGLTELLVAGTGRGGVVELGVQQTGAFVALTLSGRRAESRVGTLPGALPGAVLLARGAKRLFELLGGGFSLDTQQLVLRVLLPAAEPP